MSNVVYLKSKNDFNNIFAAYDKDSLKSIAITKDECTMASYDESFDFDFALKYDINNGCFICDKSEFDEALNNFKNNLNLISDKL